MNETVCPTWGEDGVCMMLADSIGGVEVPKNSVMGVAEASFDVRLSRLQPASRVERYE
jgi:hypothetical protein